MTDAPIHSRGTEGTRGTSLICGVFSGSPGEDTRGNPGNLAALIQPTDPLETPPDDPPEPEVPRPGYATHDDWFRLHGETHRPGLYWHGWTSPKGDAEPEPVDTWIATPIHAEAITADEHGGSYGLLLRFVNPKAQWREWAAPMHLLRGSGEELRGELLDLGVRFNPKQPRLLSAWLMEQYPRARVLAATRTGWHQIGTDRRAFVMPNRTIGADDVRFQSDHAAHDAFEARGTLDGWRDSVAKACAGNPVMVLALSVAFAGPLIQTARLQDAGGAGVHLVGDSSKGKTTALQAAASVWGGPGFLRTWRATANGLEASAAGINDTALILDEISECDPREIGAVVYALANGQGKQRARRTGGARESARWRVMLLSSGERTLAAHMGEGGRRPKAGQEARLLDVPATTRRFGAFDDLHHHPDGRSLADALKQASGAHHGHAGPAFVSALVGESQDLPALYHKTCELPAFASGDGLEGRAAGVFALAGMAGELATEYGLTGWREGEAVDAAAELYQRWREHRGTGPTEDRQILDAVREFVARHGDTRFTEIASDQPARDRAGYWRDTSEGRTWLFHSAGLTEAGGGFDLRRVLDALDGAGWIAERDQGKRSRKTHVAGAKQNLYAVRIPDDGGAA